MHDIYNLVQNLLATQDDQDAEQSLIVPLTMFFFDACGWAIVGSCTISGGVFVCKNPMLIESVGSDRDLFVSAEKGLSRSVIYTKLNPIKFDARSVTIMIACTQENWAHL